MNNLLYKIALILLIVLMNCNKVNSNTNSDQSQIKNETIKDLAPIKDEKQTIEYAGFIKTLNLTNSTVSERKERFFTFINHDIPNYWIGTKWNFNGTTRTPQKGTIACGYFITNIINDFGINLRRIYLAQQPSSTMIKTLCDQNTIKQFSKISQLKHYLDKRNDKEIFIVGLDFHTGFIIKNGKEYYFLHSNYINEEGVIKEKMETSLALNHSKSFMIGSLTANTSLFE